MNICFLESKTLTLKFQRRKNSIQPDHDERSEIEENLQTILRRNTSQRS